MIKVKCKNCGRTLLYADIFYGAMKCPKKGCKRIFEYRVRDNEFDIKTV